MGSSSGINTTLDSIINGRDTYDIELRMRCVGMTPGCDVQAAQRIYNWVTAKNSEHSSSYSKNDTAKAAS